MKHLKIAFIVIAVCAVAWCGLRIYAKHFYNKEPQAEYFYLSEIPVKPSQFEADFEEIHQIVMENYSLYQAKHLNMDSLYQTYITRVRQAQPPQTMVGSTRVHFRLTVPVMPFPASGRTRRDNFRSSYKIPYTSTSPMPIWHNTGSRIKTAS